MIWQLANKFTENQGFWAMFEKTRIVHQERMDRRTLLIVDEIKGEYRVYLQRGQNRVVTNESLLTLEAAVEQGRTLYQAMRRKKW